MLHVSRREKSILSNSINRAVDELEANLDAERKAKGQRGFAFRDRRLPPATCIKFMVNMQSSTIFKEIVDSNLFNLTRMPSPSAYVQRRDTIPLGTFRDLFEQYTEQVYWKNNARDWTFLACDGSDIRYMPNPNEPDCYIKREHKNQKDGKPVSEPQEMRCHNALHLNALFDVDRQTFVDCLIQPAHEVDERQAFWEMVDRISHRFGDNTSALKHTVFLADRGYEGYGSLTCLLRSGASFLIRLKSPSSSGMLKGLQDYLPTTDGEFDCQLHLTLTRSHKKAHLRDLNHPITLNTNIRCNEVTKDHDMDVSVRIVCVALEDGSLEYLMTNLPEDEFAAKRLRSTYFKRWSEEQGFRTLKLHLSMISFHAKTSTNICKEIYAGLIMFNFCSRLISIGAVNHKTKVYTYVINWSRAITLIRRFLSADDEMDIISLIQRQLTPIRPDRKHERHKIPRKPINFYYRTA